MTSKKRILFTIPTLDGGGAERVFSTYIRVLNPNFWNINLLLVDKTGVYLDIIPEYVNVISLGKKRTRYGLFKLYKSIRAINPDLIVSTLNRMNILVLFCSIFNSRKYKICLYEPSMPSAQFGNKYLPKYYLWLMKLLYRTAHYIIAQTEEMKAEILKYYSTPKKEIIVTINPIDTILITNQLDQANNPYKINSTINIVVSGRIREEKGQDFLLETLGNVVKTHPNFKLHILGEIGNDEYYNNLKKIIEELNLEKNVEFLGFKSNPYPYYKYADLLVLPSRWEGLPNVVLEALYLQTPVIVTNCIPYFKRLITEGENGYIVEFGDIKDLSDKILKYKSLSVSKKLLEFPNYNLIFKKMLN